jgi:ABC-type Na+ efflux pump permease subunit
VPWYRKLFGLSARGSEYRAPRSVWHNPIAWREAAARNATLGKMMARWSFIAIGALWAIAFVLSFHNGTMSIQTFRTILLSTVLGEVGVVALVAINMSATAVAREREDGTLDILLTTPLTPGSYLTGKLRGIIAYILPLLAVPLGTLLIAGAYTGLVMNGVLESEAGVTNVIPASQNSINQAIPVPAVFPEAAIIAAVICLPFIAVCVMIGMQWSVKSKGSIGSVIATVAIVLVLAGATGACAYKAGADIEWIGPALSAMSPASTVFAMIEPEAGMRKSIYAGEVGSARVGLFIGSVIFAAIYLAFVYGIHANMVRTFDMTVRKLAGTA